MHRGRRGERRPSAPSNLADDLAAILRACVPCEPRAVSDDACSTKKHLQAPALDLCAALRRVAAIRSGRLLNECRPRFRSRTRRTDAERRLLAMSEKLTTIGALQEVRRGPLRGPVPRWSTVMLPLSPAVAGDGAAGAAPLPRHRAPLGPRARVGQGGCGERAGRGDKALTPPRQDLELRPVLHKPGLTYDKVSQQMAKELSAAVPGWRLRHYLMELVFRFVANDLGNRGVRRVPASAPGRAPA